MRRTKDFSLSLTIDNNLRVKSWSDDLAAIWGRDAGKTESCLLHELIPVKKSVIQSIKNNFHNGRSVTLKDVILPCPFGSCNITLNIHPINKNDLSLGAEVFLVPIFTCHRRGHISPYQQEELSSDIATLAHGVRNPLNAIKGAAVYIREKYAREKNLIQFMDIIKGEIDRLDAFIAHYLSTSLNQKSDEIVDINSLLKKIQILTSFQVQSLDIKAVFRFGSTVKVKIKPFLIEQAILNVINNSIEAMSRGGCLKVEASAVNRLGRKYALVKISDTGTGMTKIIPRGQLTYRKGRGIGLFITREILRSVHGHLDIRSEEGKGTVVRLYFPCVER